MRSIFIDRGPIQLSPISTRRPDLPRADRGENELPPRFIARDGSWARRVWTAIAAPLFERFGHA